MEKLKPREEVLLPDVRYLNRVNLGQRHFMTNGFHFMTEPTLAVGSVIK
jgi:hypothetical protein